MPKLLLPALVIIGGLYGGGLVLTGWQSLGGGWDFSAYLAVALDQEFWQSLLLGLGLSCLVTGLTVVGGVGLALLLSQWDTWANWAVQLTLPIPHLVGIAGILLLLSPSGLLARVALAWGWIASDQDFPLLVNDRLYLGVIIHFLWKEIPFVSLFILGALRGIKDGYLQQARLLGASRWQGLWHVTLPLLRPAIAAGGIFVFGFTFSSFEVPLLLGPTAPRTLPVLVYRAFTAVDLAERQTAAVMGLILTAVAGLVIGLGSWVLSEQGRR